MTSKRLRFRFIFLGRTRIYPLSKSFPLAPVAVPPPAVVLPLLPSLLLLSYCRLYFLVLGRTNLERNMSMADPSERFATLCTPQRPRVYDIDCPQRPEPRTLNPMQQASRETSGIVAGVKVISAKPWSGSCTDNTVDKLEPC